jgi:mRNA-degrading endonuclease RelE of RelBE toxin-antitoxin system
MNWDLELARAAQRALREMPARDRERINRALNDIKTDPLSGDLIVLRGAYRGLYRRRVGSWRIIFGLKPENRVVLIGDIVRRTSTTY